MKSGAIAAIVGAVLGMLTGGANLAMNWVLGEQQIESNETVSLASIAAEKEIALAQQKQKLQANNTFAIGAGVVLLLILIIIAYKK